MDAIMRKRNIIIAILLTVGIIMFTTVQGVIIPRNEQRHQEYLKAQLEPATHDFTRILPYKSKYMGDASNIINLFYKLPLSQYGVSFQLYPMTLSAQINYKADIKTIGQSKTEKAMIYNATAAFALIDNLEAVNFTFPESETIAGTNVTASATKYKITRSDLEKWYGFKASVLADPIRWKRKVQTPLKDQTYLKKASLNLLQKSKKQATLTNR